MSTTPKKHKVLLTLDAELYAAIKADADRDGIPVATLAASRLRKHWIQSTGLTDVRRAVTKSLKCDATRS